MSAGEHRRVCLLTGAGGALGTELCRRLGEQYEIAAVYRTARPAHSAQDQLAVDPLDPGRVLADNRRPVFAVQGDLRSSADTERIVESTLSRFDRIDLVINAAVSASWAGMLGSDRLIDSAADQLLTNVVAPLRLSSVVARRFWAGRDEENRLAQRGVINVSSVAGLRLYTGSGQSIYAASKAALNLLTAHMAQEFAAVGVRVNAVAPNSFPSHVPIERVSEAIVSLDHSTLNGSIVVVDGERDEVVEIRPFEPAPAVTLHV